MQIIQDTTEFQIRQKTAVAIGKFDGIHRGHEKLLSCILEQKKKGMAAVVFTFFPSASVFFGQGQDGELTTREEKRAFFEKLGIKEPVFIGASDGGMVAETIKSLRKKYFLAPLMLFYMKHCNYEKLKPKLIKVGMGHSRNESKEELAYAKDMFETIFKDYTKEKDVHISGLLADLMKQTPVTETDFRMLKGKILLILPDQDFFSGKMQKDLIQLMHDPVIQYVSGGHLSTILKADDYVKVIRDFLGNI